MYLSPFVVGAETYIPLTELPGLSEAAVSADKGEFAGIINVIYKMAIGLGSVLAVMVIIYEGVRYAGSVIPGVKENLRQRMILTMGGLVLLIVAYMLLKFISPALIDLTPSKAQKIKSEGIEGFEGFEVETIPPPVTPPSVRSGT